MAQWGSAGRVAPASPGHQNLPNSTVTEFVQHWIGPQPILYVADMKSCVSVKKKKCHWLKTNWHCHYPPHKAGTADSGVTHFAWRLAVTPCEFAMCWGMWDHNRVFPCLAAPTVCWGLINMAVNTPKMHLTRAKANVTLLVYRHVIT